MYVIFDDQSFSDTCTNDVVKFEQLGLGKYLVGFLVEKKVSYLELCKLFRMTLSYLKQLAIIITITNSVPDAHAFLYLTSSAMVGKGQTPTVSSGLRLNKDSCFNLF